MERDDRCPARTVSRSKDGRLEFAAVSGPVATMVERAIGNDLHLIGTDADDWGNQQSLMASPATFRELFLPYRRQQIAEIEPTRVETFQLNYQKADSVAKLLSDDKQRVLSKSTLLENGYGYLRVTQFQEHTGDLLAESLNKLYKDNKTPLKGMVLDLRDDPGGVLHGAVGVSAAFLPQDALVVYTEGRAADAPPTRIGQKNNNQLATGVAKAGGGRQESVENHTSTTTGDDGNVQWMTERGGGR